MPIIDSNQGFFTPDQDQYWDVVKQTLESLFAHRAGSPPAPELLHRADSLRREIKQCSPLEQLLFYHADPLSVAADLAGPRLDMGNAEDKALVTKYNDLAARMGFY